MVERPVFQAGQLVGSNPTYPTIICCGREFNAQGIKGHRWRVHGKGRNHHPGKGLPAWNKGLKKPKAVKLANCELCGKQHNSSFGSGRFCSSFCCHSFTANINREERNRVVSRALTGRKGHSSGKLLVPRITVHCKKCGKEKVVTKSEAKQFTLCSRQCSGGLREGSGRSKSGRYNGEYFSSTWELAFYLWCIENGKQIQRNKQGFKYEDANGQLHTYYPDFIVDGKLIEIKGYRSATVERKVAAVTEPIDVMYWEDLSEVFAFAKSKTGLNVHELWKLYTTSNPV